MELVVIFCELFLSNVKIRYDVIVSRTFMSYYAIYIILTRKIHYAIVITKGLFKNK